VVNTADGAASGGLCALIVCHSGEFEFCDPAWICG